MPHTLHTYRVLVAYADPQGFPRTTVLNVNYAPTDPFAGQLFDRVVDTAKAKGLDVTNLHVLGRGSTQPTL